jgi:hypothetical protein
MKRIALLFASALALAMSMPSARADDEIAILKIVPNDDSVKVIFAPVPGAVDYRVFEVNRPNIKKYTRGNTTVEWNGIENETTLVIEAIDRLGPYMLHVDRMEMSQTEEIHINGHGEPMDMHDGGMPQVQPMVLARSMPFQVSTLPFRFTLGSTHRFLETFHDPSFTLNPTTQNSPYWAQFVELRRRFPGNRSNPSQDSGYIQLENDRWVAGFYSSWHKSVKKNGIPGKSHIFQEAGHMMSVMEDGAKHVNYSCLSMMPKATADFQGRVLHVFFEVDAHFSARRWVDVIIAPAGDMMIHNNLDRNKQLTSSGRFVSVTFRGREAFIRVWGFAPNEPAPRLLQSFRAMGSKKFRPGLYRQSSKYYNGHLNGGPEAIDLRHRFDIYLTTDRILVTEEGNARPLLNETFAPGVTAQFTNAHVWFTHQLYHSGVEPTELLRYQPYERYWIERTPTHDMRHWDNMGFEVVSKFP